MVACGRADRHAHHLGAGPGARQPRPAQRAPRRTRPAGERSRLAGRSPGAGVAGGPGDADRAGVQAARSAGGAARRLGTRGPAGNGGARRWLPPGGNHPDGRRPASRRRRRRLPRLRRAGPVCGGELRLPHRRSCQSDADDRRPRLPAGASPRAFTRSADRTRRRRVGVAAESPFHRRHRGWNEGRGHRRDRVHRRAARRVARRSGRRRAVPDARPLTAAAERRGGHGRGPHRRRRRTRGARARRARLPLRVRLGRRGVEPERAALADRGVPRNRLPPARPPQQLRRLPGPGRRRGDGGQRSNRSGRRVRPYEAPAGGRAARRRSRRAAGDHPPADDRLRPPLAALDARSRRHAAVRNRCAPGRRRGRMQRRVRRRRRQRDAARRDPAGGRERALPHLWPAAGHMVALL